MRTFFYSSLVFLSLLFSTESLGAQNLGDSLTQIIDTTTVKPAIWAVDIRDENGARIWSMNEGMLLRPASNMKLISTASILHHLGPNYHLTTRLYGLGRQYGDVWSGDLILVGGGDPSIDKHFFPDNPLAVFQKMAEDLKKKGIKRIMGSLIGNDSRYDREVYPKSWNWNDLSFYYAPQLGALSFNSNCVNLIVKADGEIGGTPKIEWFPFNTDYVSFTNLQKIAMANTDYDEYYKRMPGNNNIRLASSLPLGYVEKEDLTVDEPTLFTIDTFRRVLQKEGISFQGTIAMEHNQRNWKNAQYSLLSQHKSPSIAELVIHINKESDNFYTEMMVKEMGYFFSGTKGTTENGLSAIRSFLAEAKVDTNLVVHSDGSGLSANNLVTAESIANLLSYMRANSNFNLYLKSLPIAGVDGTLGYRMKGSPLKGKVHAKTGYISSARALSGYIETKSGRLLTFSFIANNFAEKVSRVDRIHEALLEKIYESY